MLQTTFLNRGWEFLPLKTDNTPRIGLTTQEWLPAQVPGHIHADLVANRIIGDPFVQLQEIGCQWVDQTDWSYRTSFDWDPTSKKSNQVLRFEGLDTIATITLNGEIIGTSDNMFVALELDVTDKLVAGTNTLQVDFLSAVRVGEERKAAYFEKEGLGHHINNFAERAFVRKAQYMSGWDWGPRLVSCGIWRPVSLLNFDERITGVNVVTKSTGGSTWNVQFDVETSGTSEVRFEIIDPFGQVIEAPNADGELIIEEATEWTPNSPELYSARITLVRDGQELDEKFIEFGLREIKLLREADEQGESFEFEINGKKLWARGANWIPDHSLPSLVDTNRLRDRLEKAKDMGCNMLRIWGGGLYETEEFYDLCDELGILVWQDFPFACCYYPDDEAFQAVITAEATANIKRLRRRASLALWCGNNENLTMHQSQWGGPEGMPPRYYGLPIYEELLPNLLAELDPHHCYISTSPIGAPSEEVEPDAAKRNANVGDYGDQHCWDVWHGRGDWRFYSDSTARFSSEYGFASSCHLACWSGAAGLDVETESPTGPSIVWHDKTGKGTEKFHGYVKLHYPESATLADWVYTSQLNQRDAIRYGLEHYRRSSFCRGSLIWQLNDCWPTQSWAMLDYDGNYKAVAYELRRLHADALCSIVRDNDKISVHAVNDDQIEWGGAVLLQAIQLQTGAVLREWREEAFLSPNERKVVLEATIEGLATPDTLLVAQWGFDLTWQLLSEPKQARFAAPSDLLVSTAEEVKLRIETSTPLVDLQLLNNGTVADFIDNYVTVIAPGVFEVGFIGTVGTLSARSLAGQHKVKVTRSPL